MANTERRRGYINKYGNMFMPMNVEGGNYQDSFLTMPKMVTLFGILVGAVFIWVLLGSHGAALRAFLIVYAIYFFACTFLIRYVVFEEKYYLRMYRKLKQYEVSTPSVFWDISSRKHVEEGTILLFSDGKVGCICKMERDTITGKQEDFREIHYDAWSDFYNDLITKGYCLVQMNTMEPAGKDPRLAELDKLTYKDDNKNICQLAEMMLAYIKEIARNSLFESDYFLIYSTDMSKVDKITDDIADSMTLLLNGAYIGYTILDDKEIADRVREEYGVEYFNLTEASLMMFKQQIDVGEPPFSIAGIVWEDGNEQKLRKEEVQKTNNLTRKIIRGSIKQREVSFRDSVYRKEEKEKVGFDFESLGELPEKKLNPRKARSPFNKNKNERPKTAEPEKKIDIEEQDDKLIDF